MKKLTQKLSNTPPANIIFTPAPDVDLTIRSVEATFGDTVQVDMEWPAPDEWRHGEVTDTSIDLGHPAVIVRPYEEGSVDMRALSVMGAGVVGGVVMGLAGAFAIYPLVVFIVVWLAVEVLLTTEPDLRQKLEFFA